MIELGYKLRSVPLIITSEIILHSHPAFPSFEGQWQIFKVRVWVASWGPSG